jgi:predicted nuclease of restriction endonuclease-like (RecB) superfamily
MSKIKNNKIRKIYAEETIKNGWSNDMLNMQIESNYHLRIGNSSNNFKVALKDSNSDLANNIIKDPYIFDFLTLKETCKEKELENALINRIKEFLLEMGKGFSFVGNQYKVSTENSDYYIDLLFYHLELRCYIVVELKTTEFKPEYIGQLGFYITAVNETLRKKDDNQTIGLLLCRNKDKLTVNWSLKSTNLPIGISSFKFNKYLPTEKDLNLHINIYK